MGHIVRAGGAGRIKLNEKDVAASVLQNIAILLSTRQQSVPMYRGFGLPMRFVDMPAGAARAVMVAEITEAVREFEPRAEVAGVTFEADGENPGRVSPVVEVDIADEGA